jgi:hypothetical protein
MSDRDLFSSLYPWARRQGENFTTDAFVAVLRELLEREQSWTCAFLGWLCFEPENPNAFLDAKPDIDTQFRAAEGRPDIRIRNYKVFCLVEVKKTAGLHDGQLQQYQTILNGQNEQWKPLVLLTVHPVEPDSTSPRHLHRSWDKIRDRLEQVPPSHVVSEFLVREFIRFLRSEQMTIEKVGSELIEGLHALGNLMDLLNRACHGATGQPPSKSCGSEWMGWGVDKRQFWAGVYLDQPESLRFEFLDAEPNDVDRLREIDWDQSKLYNKWGTTFDFRDQATDFFNSPKVRQLELMTTFVQEAFQTAQKFIPQKSIPGNKLHD